MARLASVCGVSSGEDVTAWAVSCQRPANDAIACVCAVLMKRGRTSLDSDSDSHIGGGGASSGGASGGGACAGSMEVIRLADGVPLASSGGGGGSGGGVVRSALRELKWQAHACERQRAQRTPI